MRMKDRLRRLLKGYTPQGWGRTLSAYGTDLLASTRGQRAPSMPSTLVLLVTAAAAVSASACADLRVGPKRGVIADGGAVGAKPDPACEPGPASCAGTIATSCIDGEEQSVDCGDKGQVCAPKLGCVRCQPGAGRCDGEITQRCSDEGDRWVSGEVCDGVDGVHCGEGTCSDLCAAAAEAKDYLGCDYWAATLPNEVSQDFDFAIVINNPQSVTADIHITAMADGEAAHFSRDDRVEAETIKTIRLPWRSDTSNARGFRYASSGYHIGSSVPVAVFQFNPLEYQLPADCSDPDRDNNPSDGLCHSMTNDASLLLPTPVLQTTYLILSAPAGSNRLWFTNASGSRLPLLESGDLEANYHRSSVFTVVGTQDATTLTVTPGTKVDSTAGSFDAGEAFVLTLDAGETQSIFTADTDQGCPGRTSTVVVPRTCEGVACSRHFEFCEGNDLSGTKVVATKPVAVYSGSPCAFVPFDRYACDHLEEAQPPLQTWGKEAIVAKTHGLYGEPNVIRIISAADDNALTFEPESISAPVTLGLGEVIELTVSESFQVRGTEPLLVAQLLVGQDYDGEQAATARYDQGVVRSGDPSLTFVAPVEQWRRKYEFLTPNTYAEAWVTITARSSAVVTLDGKTLTDSSPIAGTPYVVFHAQVGAGGHTLRSSLPAAVQVYGFGEYTSYMFPGGLELQKVNELL